MGFRYKKCNGRRILCEQPYVKAQKLSFLKKYMQYSEDESVVFIFLDKTWIYENGSRIRMWIHESNIKANPKTIKNEGKRFTILHAGCIYGFLDGCSMFLDSRIDHRDYHKTMHGAVFKELVEKQLIPSLKKIPGKCVVIMDNAPYHSVRSDKRITSTSNNEDMRAWLQNKNIEFDKSLIKKQLLALIKPLIDQEKKSYIVDTLLHSHGYDVLRLPPYNCQYNPIELAWAFTKSYYNKHINEEQAKSPNTVRRVWEEALLHFTPDILLAIFLQSLYLLWNLTLQVNLNGQILINFNITYILFFSLLVFSFV
jgi:transposase